ncbi:hypothetical protein Bca52824_070640 [Brassica carinata]|uniref:Uncharacterized protein n=1 Tax=Brassica carinata TaxID=52824 RepID=A0A8X7Q4L2_BRACI|nr:hypothetical protein Bca52824_070640 [Brassica carinata]
METFLLGLVDLHNNKLTGPIPPQIGRLKRLKVLETLVCVFGFVPCVCMTQNCWCDSIA